MMHREILKLTMEVWQCRWSKHLYLYCGWKPFPVGLPCEARNLQYLGLVAEATLGRSNYFSKCHYTRTFMWFLNLLSCVSLHRLWVSREFNTSVFCNPTSEPTGKMLRENGYKGGGGGEEKQIVVNTCEHTLFNILLTLIRCAIRRYNAQKACNGSHQDLQLLTHRQIYFQRSSILTCMIPKQ